MDISSISSQGMTDMKSIMELIKSKINSAVSEANQENDNVLGTSLDLSNPSQLLSKLSQLQSTDPEKFKELMSDIADSLSEAADEAGADTQEGIILSDFAAKFKSAGETGDLSSLQPPPPPPPPQGSDMSKIAQYSQNSSNSEASTLLDLLQLLESDSEDSSSSTSLFSKNTLSSIEDLLAKAFQNMLRSKTSESGSSTIT